MKVLYLLLAYYPLAIQCFTVVQNHHQTTATPKTTAVTTTTTPTALQMGLFDSFSKAFSNEEYSAPPEGVKATARHILVKSKDDIDIVLNELQSGTPFGTVASQYSTCPSRAQGGSLGSFRPGTMVAEFDAVIFDKETDLGTVVGPVQTQFGYHLIVVDKRTGV